MVKNANIIKNLHYESTDTIHGLYTSLVLLLFSTFTTVYTLHDLEPEQRISVYRGTTLFFSGLIFFSSLYYFLHSYLNITDKGKQFVIKYSLKKPDVYDICNKTVSIIQAIFCVFTGSTCSFYSCTRDMIRTSHYISEAYGWFGSSYFFYDIWSMFGVYKFKIEEKNKGKGDGHPATKNGPTSVVRSFWSFLMTNGVIVIHHLFVGIVAFLVIVHLRGDFGDCFFGTVYLMESSTPFVSLRSILSIMGEKNSWLYVTNGIAMLISFFLFRVIMFPYVLSWYAAAKGFSFIQGIKSLPISCIASILFLMLPQFYWFMLMIKGASKMLINSNKNEEVKKKTENREEDRHKTGLKQE